MTACRLCDGECRDANLRPLLAHNLLWLWQQAAVIADRRGDPALTDGTITIKAPESPEQRAAALGLIPGRALIAGQSRRISLADLATAVRRHGPALTPGAVAAHATERQLATRARRRQDRHHFEQDVAALGASWAAASRSPLAAIWETMLPALRTAGWLARLQASTDAGQLLRHAFAIIDALPETGTRLDRRLLATNSTANPHALDEGQPLAALVLAMLAAAGISSPTQRPRDTWSAVGVDCDDLTGGLIAIGIHPDGWQIPAGDTVTLLHENSSAAGGQPARPHPHGCSSLRTHRSPRPPPNSPPPAHRYACCAPPAHHRLSKPPRPPGSPTPAGTSRYARTSTPRASRTSRPCFAPRPPHVRGG